MALDTRDPQKHVKTGTKHRWAPRWASPFSLYGKSEFTPILEDESTWPLLGEFLLTVLETFF